MVTSSPRANGDNGGGGQRLSFLDTLLRIYHVRVPACGARFAGGPAHRSTDSTTFFQGLLTVDRQYLDAVFLCGP